MHAKQQYSLRLEDMLSMLHMYIDSIRGYQNQPPSAGFLCAVDKVKHIKHDLN